MEARTLPNRAQRAPRGGQDGPKTEKEDRPNINRPRRIRGRRVLSEKVANMAPSWPPNRSKIEEKSMQKSIEKTMHLGIDFWKDFGGFLDEKWRHVGTKIEPKSIPTSKSDFLKKPRFKQ